MLLSRETEGLLRDALRSIQTAAIKFGAACDTVKDTVENERKTGGAIERIRAAADKIAQEGIKING